MLGRIMNELQTYDYMENDKYKKIGTLIHIMKETFGYEIEDLVD